MKFLEKYLDYYAWVGPIAGYGTMDFSRPTQSYSFVFQNPNANSVQILNRVIIFEYIH
jgi:hypothetical protein